MNHISIAVICMMLLMLIGCLLKMFLFPKRRHRWYIQRAEKVYRTVNGQAEKFTLAQTMEYLRHINPYVFEELLLYAFKRKGFKVIHNTRYSGDGGIDGYVLMDGKRIPIQAKRYRDYVKGKHIASFSQVVKRKKAPFGFFIHTGRTGKAGYDPSYETVRIISGNKLMDLLLEKKECPTWLQKYK